MEAVRLCSKFPELFGEDLDRKTLWKRIGSAIETSIIKSNNDLSVFVNSCLAYIKADTGKVACHEDLSYWLDTNSKKSKEWIMGFFHYLSTRYFLVIAKARQEWEARKNEKAIERKRGGTGNGN